jgi:hypothetical protein
MDGKLMLDETELHKNRDKFLEQANAYNKMRRAQFDLEREHFNEYCEPLDMAGYPHPAALRLIENWHHEYKVDWFDFIHSMWYAADWGWKSEVVPHRFREGKSVMEFEVSTAGWSGNESIIKAMQKNGMLWWMVHYQTTRGGHYIFELEIEDVSR